MRSRRFDSRSTTNSDTYRQSMPAMVSFSHLDVLRKRNVFTNQAEYQTFAQITHQELWSFSPYLVSFRMPNIAREWVSVREPYSRCMQIILGRSTMPLFLWLQFKSSCLVGYRKLHTGLYFDSAFCLFVSFLSLSSSFAVGPLLETRVCYANLLGLFPSLMPFASFPFLLWDDKLLGL